MPTSRGTLPHGCRSATRWITTSSRRGWAATSTSRSTESTWRPSASRRANDGGPREARERLLRPANKALGSGLDEERLGGDAEGSLDRERRAGEEAAGIAFFLARACQPQRDALTTGDPCAELDRRPVVLRPCEGDEHGTCRRRLA